MGRGIGLTDGLYNHTLPPLLTAMGMPPGVLKAIYPTYVAASGAFVMACDGVQFRYCAVTAASVLYEVAGIAEFVISCLLAVGVYGWFRSGACRRTRFRYCRDGSRSGQVSACWAPWP